MDLGADRFAWLTGLPQATWILCGHLRGGITAVTDRRRGGWFTLILFGDLVMGNYGRAVLAWRYGPGCAVADLIVRLVCSAWLGNRWVVVLHWRRCPGNAGSTGTSVRGFPMRPGVERIRRSSACWRLLIFIPC